MVIEPPDVEPVDAETFQQGSFFAQRSESAWCIFGVQKLPGRGSNVSTYACMFLDYAACSNLLSIA